MTPATSGGVIMVTLGSAVLVDPAPGMPYRQVTFQALSALLVVVAR